MHLVKTLACEEGPEPIPDDPGDTPPGEPGPGSTVGVPPD